MLLQPHCWVSSVPNESSFESDDLFDLVVESDSTGSPDPDVDLISLSLSSSESDSNTAESRDPNVDVNFPSSLSSESDRDAADSLDHNGDLYSLSLPSSESYGDVTESSDPNFDLNSLSLLSDGSDSYGLGSSEQSNDLVSLNDINLAAAVDDECFVNNGQSRKRDGVACPAPGITKFPSGIFQDEEDDFELDKDGLDSQGRSPYLCGDIGFLFGRIFDVCCDGPFGPFKIDPGARLIYNWISTCRLGMFELNVPALTCVLKACEG